MTSELPAYSGRAKLCPKCRISYMGTVYHHNRVNKVGGREAPCKFNSLAISEHFCRICPNCGFGLVEACADAQDDEQSSEQCQTTSR